MYAIYKGNNHIDLTNDKIYKILDNEIDKDTQQIMVLVQDDKGDTRRLYHKFFDIIKQEDIDTNKYCLLNNDMLRDKYFNTLDRLFLNNLKYNKHTFNDETTHKKALRDIINKDIYIKYMLEEILKQRGML